MVRTYHLLKEDLYPMKKSPVKILLVAPILVYLVLKYIWAKKIISMLDSSPHQLRIPIESSGSVLLCFRLRRSFFVISFQ